MKWLSAAFVLLHLALLGQDAATGAETLGELKQLRQTLAEKFRAMEERHRHESAAAREKARSLWREENRSELQAVRAMQLQLAESKPLPELRLIEEVQIPNNAPVELEEFLVERARLHNERATVERETREASADAKAAAIDEWREQNRDRLEAQHRRAELLGRQSSHAIVTLSEHAYIPESASAELKRFLIARHQLARERRAEEERIKHLPPEETAIERMRWQEKNAERLAALAAYARQLSE